MIEYGTHYNNLILIGDFNTNIMKASLKSNRFKDTLMSLSLFNVGLEPTFFHPTGASQLDLMLTDNVENVLRFN